MNQPNILYILTDQMRADVLDPKGPWPAYLPNLRKLVDSGVTCTQAYSSCPVCVPARYSLRTGCEPPKTRFFMNKMLAPASGQAEHMEERCGPYLARQLSNLGYETWGVGKFHSVPWHEDIGFQRQAYSEEIIKDLKQMEGDDYTQFVKNSLPSTFRIPQLQGERSEMYYMPQCSLLPVELTVEHWVVERAIQELHQLDGNKPFYGFVSFIGPHPPCAPPVPFNYLFNPEDMPPVVRGDPDEDRRDPFVQQMNYSCWSEQVDPVRTQTVRARYLGELAYIDQQIGRLLDALAASGQSENTLIVFTSDHGDMLGDHQAWQKESYFEASTRIPMVLSWPDVLPANSQYDGLCTLTDLFGLATEVAGSPEYRDGHPLLPALIGTGKPRDSLYGFHGLPGTELFKAMVRQGDWKAIYFANGGDWQLFNLKDDPLECLNLADRLPEQVESFESLLRERLKESGVSESLTETGELKQFPRQELPKIRNVQFGYEVGLSTWPSNHQERQNYLDSWTLS